MSKITIKDIVDIDYDKALKIICEFINEYVKETGIRKFIIGLSGGVDSATLLAILVHSVGEDNVIAVLMPDERAVSKRDVEDALNLVKMFHVKYLYIPLNNILDAYKIIPFYDEGNNLARGNLATRIRMSILYYYANAYNYLVAGSSDRSELLIGYYTKYGDAAADILPLGSLYKTQVRRLAVKLGIPEEIAYKPSSPGFWSGHLAEEEIGMKYEEVDIILYCLFDLGLKPEEIPGLTGISMDKVLRVLKMHRASRHKRGFPPIPRLPWVKEPVYEI